MRNMPTGQFVPGKSVIHRLDARVKIISLFIILAAIIATSTFWGYLFILCITAAVIALSGISLADAVGPARRLWSFFIIIFLMNALFFDSADAYWSFWIFNITKAGIIQGANVVIRVMLFMIFGNVLTCATAPIDITGALESLLKPLKLLRVPVEDVAMIISVALQFIPTLLDETDMIKKAQIARGARFESRKLSEKAASMAPLVIPVFLSAFRRADELSVAMEARGYKNARDRTKRARPPLCTRDFEALLASAVTCFLSAFVF